MVRSLLAAQRSDWETGALVGWVVDRLLVCWPVSVDVVVAVDMLLVVCLREGGLRNQTGGGNLIDA